MTFLHQPSTALEALFPSLGTLCWPPAQAWYLLGKRHGKDTPRGRRVTKERLREKGRRWGNLGPFWSLWSVPDRPPHSPTPGLVPVLRAPFLPSLSSPREVQAPARKGRTLSTPGGVQRVLPASWRSCRGRNPAPVP